MKIRPSFRALAPSALFPRFGEALMAVAIVTIVGFCVLFAGIKGASIDVPMILKGQTVSTVFFAVGVVYRLTGRSERIGAALIALGLMSAFTVSLTVYNHLLLPVSAPLIDPLLFRFNVLVGYHWPDWVEWGARNPEISALLARVYQSSVAQVILLLVALGLTNRHVELDRMMMTIAIGALATISFWSLFPSISISAFESTSPEVERAASLVLGRAAGEQLLHFVTHGIDQISMETMTGLIGFPSFHTVLALACIRFAWYLPFARWPFVALNAAMFPAILLHGSHHVADVLGGIATFALAIWGAERLLRLGGVPEDFHRNLVPGGTR